MSYVTTEQISELSQDSFRDKSAFVSRGASKIAYTLVTKEKSGMKIIMTQVVFPQVRNTSK